MRVFCHCTYAQVVPPDTKRAVLERLCASDAAFEAVPDLCDMAARKDPALARLAGSAGLKIAACYPRAVRWLFHSAGAALPADAQVLNMREAGAEDVADALLGDGA